MARACVDAIGLVLLVFGAASAQERAPIAQTTAAQWSGFHVGGEIGQAWNSYTWNMNANYYNTLGANLLGSTVSEAQSGLMGGALGGYTWAVGPVLLGGELSVRTGGPSQQTTSPWFPATDVYRTDVYWRASVTARAGYAWDRLQVFAKAGWAGADVGRTIIDRGTGITASSQRWVNGWTVGAGAEYMVFPGIALGLTWDYTDLSASGEAMNCPRCGTGVGLGSPVVDSNIRLNAVMARITFRPGL